MASKLKHVRFSATGPAELKPLIRQRMKELPYSSESHYLMGLILYDLMCRRDHRVTSPLMAQPPDVRDKVIEQIIDDMQNNRRSGRAQEDGWFERRIKEIAEREIAKRGNGR